MAFDVAVVGAGPAGLAAAVHAGDCGLAVVLIDAGQQPGGQFWRHRDEEVHGASGTPAEGAGDEGGAEEGAGHHDWKTFTELRSRLYAHETSGRVRYLRGTQLWLLDTPAPDGTRVLQLSPVLEVPADGTPAAEAAPGSVRAGRLVLCPGGYDRQLPVPGWELPGVMAAGGVQALLKGSMVVPGGTGVVGGTGPFLLPVAAGLARAGVKVAAVCEANSPTGWLRNLRGAVRAPEKVPEGVEYAAVLARHRIPYRTRTAVTEIHGTDRVEAVTLSKLTPDGAVVAGSGRRVPCDFVALGWGFTPSLELVLAAGAATALDVDGSLVAVVDDRLNSSVPGVSVAGEATGIGGAAMAVVEGELAALSAAAARGGESPDLPGRIARLQRERARLRAFAVAMHRANPVPARWTGWLTPDTIVCRCEEASYGDLCNAHAELGADDARSLKSYARPGMGWCQGRVCGFATTSIAADLAGRGPTAEDLQAMSKRTLAAPVSLGRLAALTDSGMELPHGAAGESP
ncbi:FAD/NAD(P)-binding oxidoreductase [Arthrobacter stackebrandtii]|nr:FAD/NAD(P)-binding oxidoreductase [Arthrobacter stackebrandtii]